MINRTTFFQQARERLFAGHISQPQVDGLNVLLDEGEARALDVRWIAYVLATTFHETARTMQPIRESGLGATHIYGRTDPATKQAYYGRGYVQLTWKDNYRRVGDKIGVDLVREPDRAMEPPIATKIIYVGMIEGLFTGDKLANHFRGPLNDWYSARRIINGLDCANQIGRYAIDFNVACMDPTNIAPMV